MELVERDQELHRLSESLADAIAGRGGVVVLRGPVARGKTALLRALAEQAGAAGALVLTAVGSPFDRNQPCGVVQQLLAGAPLPPRAAQDTKELLHNLAALGDPSTAGEAPLAERGIRDAMHELHRIPLALLAEHPVVVAVDDVQYADDLSLRWLLQLTNRVGLGRLLVVLAERTGVRPETPLYDAVLRQPHCQPMNLAGLSPRGVQIQLALGLGPRAAAALCGFCAELSDGNPLLVQALITDHLARTAADPAAEVAEILPGEAFGQAVVGCLHRCGPAAAPVAAALAVLGDAGTPARLARLSEVDPLHTAQLIRTFHTIGLLRDGRFRHPAARQAVLSGLSPRRAVELHRLAAALLYDEDADLGAVAEHLLKAGAGGGAGWEAQVLEDAADQAVADHRYPFAVECLELASRSRTAEDSRGRLVMKLAAAQFRTNPALSTRYLTRLVAALRGGDLHGPQAVEAIEYLLWHGRHDEAEAALRHLSDASRGDQARAPLRGLLLSVAGSYPWLNERITAGAEHDVADPDHAGHHPAMRAAVAFNAVLRGSAVERGAAVADRILQRGRLSNAMLDTLGVALSTLVYADRLDLAAKRCEELLAEAGTRSDPVGEALFAAISADIAYRRGDLATAEERSSSAFALLPAQNWGVGIGLPMAGLLTAHTELGDYGKVEELLDLQVPEATFRSRFGLQYRYARGRYYLASGKLQAALEDLQGCGEQMTAWGIDQPGLAPWRVDAAWTLIGLRRVDEARRLAEQHLDRVGAERSRARGLGLRVLAATAEPAQRQRLLWEAVEVLTACGARLELARALGDLGQVSRLTGRPDRARLLIRRAWQLAKACGAAPLCQALIPQRPASVRSVRAQRGDEPDGVLSLSGAEQRVAYLAGQGFTNREIARRLFITVSTVEQHLTRVYRKLKVNRRSDLPAGPLARIASTA